MGSFRFLDTVFENMTLGVSFRGKLVDGEEFHLRETSVQPQSTVYEGNFEDVLLRLTVWQEDSGLIRLQAGLHSERPFHCDKIIFQWWYHELQADLSQSYVPGGNFACGIAGLKKLRDVPVTPEDVRFCGLFHGSTAPCLLFGTVIPSNWILKYQAALEEASRVRFTATNYFTSSTSDQHHLETETVCVITGLTPRCAVERYGQLLPRIPDDEFETPLVGWSTWDYYFTAICPEDLEENMAAIRENPVLSQKITSFFVDDGWQYREGEWVANQRFPMGTRGIAQRIRENGFVPGIWTNGCQVWFLTHTGLRCGEMFLKDEQGNAITFENRLIIDPTHPMGEAYLYETYQRLREDGFALFKVDFVSSILLAEKFYDPACGPYEAIRRLFRIIRRAVGQEAKIIGCSYPADCGPGLVESCRIGVDIHNHWSHVLWVMEYMQMSFWENQRLYRVDPDFLVVRGSETSLEAETNVFNPAPCLPVQEYAASNRWRRGPVFDAREAETWANLVVFCGGNIVAGDRIRMLNQQGLELLQKHLESNRAAAVPLDLGDGLHARFWYSAEDRKLLVINLETRRCTMCADLAQYGIALPEVVTCEKPFAYENGRVEITLEPHESAVFAW